MRKKSACGRQEDLTKLTHMEAHMYVYIYIEREREMCMWLVHRTQDIKIDTSRARKKMGKHVRRVYGAKLHDESFENSGFTS